jgi:hypothetical protein
MLENEKLVVFVEFSHCLQQMPGISANPGWLKIHQPCIDANAHEMSRLPCMLETRYTVLMIEPLIVPEPACAIVTARFCSGQSAGCTERRTFCGGALRPNLCLLNLNKSRWRKASRAKPTDRVIIAPL